MKKGWSEVALGEVLHPQEETCRILTEVEYREVTVSLWGKGVRLRRKVSGSEIAAPVRNVARTGDFIVSKIPGTEHTASFPRTWTVLSSQTIFRSMPSPENRFIHDGFTG